MSGRKVFTAGEVLTATDVNGYLMDQAVQVFADSATRATAIGTVTEGMVTYVNDQNQIQHYTGSTWLPLPYGFAAGSITMTGNGTRSQSASVTFPTSRFSVAPIITATCAGSSTLLATTSAGSATGFTLVLNHIDASTWSTSQTTHWVAVQMTAGTAAG